LERFLSAFQDLAVGRHKGQLNGKRYVFSKSTYTTGESWKLVAKELGSTDYISLNLYDLASGPRLCPWEMPADKVIAFVCGLIPER
jgi:hypothetical protein